MAVVCVTVVAVVVGLIAIVAVPVGRYERLRELSFLWCGALRG